MRCTKCNKEIPNESRFCRYCGTPVKVWAEVDNPPSRRCKKCGALIKDENAFCDQCGSPAEKPEIETEDSEKQVKPEKRVIKARVIICVLFLFAFLVGMGIYISTGNKRTDDIGGEDKKAVLEDDTTAIKGQHEETEEASVTSTQQNATGAISDLTKKQNETEKGSDDLTIESEIDTITAETSVGDIVYYGAYEQNNNPEDGNEQLEWLVLDVEDGRYLLITSKVIDCVCYNNVWKDTAWVNCTLRDWLNTSFLKKAFTENQIDKIFYSEHTDEEGNIASDQVFVMNTKELEEYFDSNEQRTAGATSFAEAQGVYVYNNRKCWWWVSDAGADPHYARYVNCEGAILEYGMLVFNNAFGVRPAIWVNE